MPIPVLCAATVLLVALCSSVQAQSTPTPDIAEQIKKLNEAMARSQAQIEESQRQLQEMRRQLDALQAQAAQVPPLPVPPPTPPSDDLHERQAMQESQIATLDQAKVESDSKYPVKVTGLLLLNGFVNTRAVDMPATPTIAIPGTGSTGASVRQTVLGLDARGPHLLGARSYADLRVDFDGSPQLQTSSSNYSGYYASSTLLRLRTVHAGLQWQNTEAYFSLDRPILSPDTPTSLTAVSEPALAWSGNLWTWNPQLGITHDLPVATTHDIRLQAALIDVGDAPTSAADYTSAAAIPATAAEQSREPGVEARIALLGSKSEDKSHIGFGGYFSPHLSPLGRRYDAWAGTLDAKWRLPANLEFSGSFFRGAALGGLGAGAYKDFGYSDSTLTNHYYFRPLDDVGGWTQLKETLNPHVQLNAAFGIDNVFAQQLRRYYVPSGPDYLNLARNRTFTANIIYSPSTYLLFSLEYRHIESAPVIGFTTASDIIGLAAGYRF